MEGDEENCYLEALPVVALSTAVGAVEMTPSAEAPPPPPAEGNVVQLDGGLRPYQ